MKRWLKLSFLIGLSLLGASSASAQAGFSAGIVWRYTPAGAFPAGGATITICTALATGTPCSPTVTVYALPALAVPVTNPLAQCTVAGQVGCVDNIGNFSFYTTTGQYTYTVTGAGLTPYGPIPIIADDIVGGTTATNLQGPGAINGAFSGTPTLSGLWTFNAGLTSAGPNSLSGGGSLAGTFTGNPTMSGLWTFSNLLTTVGIVPSVAGASSIGTAPLPYQKLFVGGAANTTTAVSSTATANRTAAYPDTSGTISFWSVTQCGALPACSAAAQPGKGQIVTGTIVFAASTTASVTGMPTFTSATTYACTMTNPSHSYTWLVTAQTATGFTITSGTSNSDTWNWACSGY